MSSDAKIWVGFGLAIVVALGLGFLGWKSYAPSGLVSTQTGQTTPTKKALEYTKTSLGERHHTENAEMYDIDATYPDDARITDTAGSVSNAAAVRVMEEFIASQIDEFKSNANFENLTPPDKKILGFDSGTKYALGITFEEASSPKTVSFIFTIHVDTGGAHPNTFYQTFTWAREGKQLLLADLFFPGKPYLSAVAAPARAQVVQSLEGRGASADAIFEDGFALNDDNFSNFYLDGENLVIIFPPYQVAAYAAGTQKATIPLASLKDVKEEYR